MENKKKVYSSVYSKPLFAPMKKGKSTVVKNTVSPLADLPADRLDEEEEEEVVEEETPKKVIKTV